jgi:hypothetical protein
VGAVSQDGSVVARADGAGFGRLTHSDGCTRANPGCTDALHGAARAKVAKLFTQQPRRGIVGVRAEVHCFVWSASAAHAWREADGPERTEQRHSTYARKRHGAG